MTKPFRGLDNLGGILQIATVHKLPDATVATAYNLSKGGKRVEFVVASESTKGEIDIKPGEQVVIDKFAQKSVLRHGRAVIIPVADRIKPTYIPRRPFSRTTAARLDFANA